jgi:hypothetical protein
MTITYEVIIGLIYNYICFDFVSMLTNLKKRRKFVPCKHLHFISRTWMFCNHKTYNLMNYPTLGQWSFANKDSNGLTPCSYINIYSFLVVHSALVHMSSISCIFVLDAIWIQMFCLAYNAILY